MIEKIVIEFDEETKTALIKRPGAVEEGWEVINACVDRSLLNPKTPEN